MGVVSWHTDLNVLKRCNHTHPKLHGMIDLKSEFYLHIHVHSHTRDSLICDWIWEKPPSTHNYKYLEIPILIIWSSITQEGK